MVFVTYDNYTSDINLLSFSVARKVGLRIKLIVLKTAFIY